MRAWHIGIGAALVAAAPLIAATKPAPAPYAQAVGDPARPATDRERDADRKPAEMLAFAGVKPGMKVAELAPGGGYFTRLLSDSVGPDGKVYAVSTRPLPWLDAWNADHHNVVLQSSPLPAPLAPEPVDLVWTTQNYHDFKNRPADASGKDGAAQYNAAAFAALKPGGVYLVSDHQGAPGTAATQTGTLHRIEDAVVIREVEAAGFKLAGRSDVLRHPADDHTAKVFETGVRGKTDQFVLRFVKPAGKR
jgi:predicted methyltransferase